MNKFETIKNWKETNKALSKKAGGLAASILVDMLRDDSSQGKFCTCRLREIQAMLKSYEALIRDVQFVDSFETDFRFECPDCDHIAIEKNLETVATYENLPPADFCVDLILAVLGTLETTHRELKICLECLEVERSGSFFMNKAIKTMADASTLYALACSDKLFKRTIATPKKEDD